MSPVKSPEKSSARDAVKNDKIVVVKDEAEDLPPGWTTEAKVRRSGSITKVDRYYTDPVTGYVFRSLKDVQRYLKTGEVGRLAKKPKMKEGEEASEEKEQMSETMTHKRAATDNSESPTRASKRLAGIHNDAPSPPLSQPKTRQATRLGGIKVDSASPLQSLSLPKPRTRQATRLAEVTVDAPPSSSSLPEPKTRQAARLAGVTVDRSLPSSSSPDTRTNQHATRQSGTSPAAPKTRHAVRLAGVKIDSPLASKTLQAKPLMGTEFGALPPSQPEPRTRQAKRVSGIRDNASLTSPPQPKTRSAIREAGIKIDSPPPSPPDTRTSRQATKTRLVTSATPKENDKKTEANKITDKHNKEKSITISPLNQKLNEKQEGRDIVPPLTPKEHYKQIEMQPTAPEEEAPPTVVPPVNLEKQELPVNNATTSNSSDMKTGSSINFSMNDLWTDPCIEFAVKTLTGDIPFPDLNKVENITTTPSQVPLEELWTDPCIEFAVKTLTGDIPVREDDYLQHRPASITNPQGLHQFISPDVVMNSCQTDALSKNYETVNKNKQQDSVFQTLGNSGFQKQQDVVFPTLGNGVFQKQQQDLMFRTVGNSGFQKQQDLVFPTLGNGGFQKPQDLVFPTLGNGGFQKPQDLVFPTLGNGGFQMPQDLVFPTLGNSGFQKPGTFVNGSNGQCSRSRFFQ